MGRLLALGASVLTAAWIVGCARADSSVDSTHARALRIAHVVDSLTAAGDTIRLTSTHDTARVPILVYHSVAHHHAGQTGEQRELDVDTEIFRIQMAYIARRHLPVIPLARLVDALEGRASLPDGAVVITFDDGWQDQFEDAFPVLQQYGFTATFFIYTNIIGNGSAFMTWDEVRRLQHDGMTIGAHSRSHPMLTKVDGRLADEIEGSRADIQRNVGVAPDLFAYPYGDWDERIADEVRSAGFRAARAMGGGPLNTAHDVFALRSILATDDMKEFERELSARAK